ncbi:hypothetical protein LOD99_11784 [Oopsacas minuta]|uniref:Uncharacterized protein n=1 Tax=Oopsacas minuta TaxID=111878 RepID=A0AAV7JLW8_9METZ|nr:hypothetical protein LOD99_11784 [Oopsacas minuta]
MTMIRSVSLDDMKDQEPEILFSGYVKKMCRRFRLWQQRVLTLNSHGDLYLTKINNKDPISFSSYCPQKNQKPPVNIFQLGVVTRQGQVSDGKWPKKLDLRQSLVVESKSTKFLFLPSIQAAEALRTQLQILQWRTDSELEKEEESLVVKRRHAIKRREHPIQKEQNIHPKSNIAPVQAVQGILNMKELGKFAENVKSQLIQKSEAIHCQEEGDQSITVSCILSLDFEVRENLVSCKVSHSLEDLTKMDKLPSKSSSLLRLLKNSEYDNKPKPILKNSKQEYFSRPQKSQKKVRFDSAQAFRISTPANPRSVQLNWQNEILPNFYQHVRKHSFDAINN